MQEKNHISLPRTHHPIEIVPGINWQGRWSTHNRVKYLVKI